VNSTDYQVWRGRFGTAAGSGTASSLEQPAGATDLVDPPTDSASAVESSNIMSNAATPVKKPATTLLVSETGSSQRTTRRSGLIRPFNASMFRDPWFSLLSVLADAKKGMAGPDVPSLSTATGSPENGSGKCTNDQSDDASLALSAWWKTAKSAL
jgi:hypothetical protein